MSTTTTITPRVPGFGFNSNVGGRNNDLFVLFRSMRKVFEGCSYILGVLWVGNHQTIHTDPVDLKVARRRIEAAICSFGGYIKDAQSRDDTDTYTATTSSASYPYSSTQGS